MPGAARMAGEQAQPPEVRLGQRHPERRGAVGRFEIVDLVTEDGGVERLGLHRPAAGPSARSLRVIVGVAGYPAQPQRGVPLDEGDHLGAGVQVGAATFGGDDVADDRGQVALGVGRGVGDAGGLQGLVVRDPHPAAGSGGGTTVVRGLLDHHHRQSLVRGGERRRHPRRAAAHHDDVELGGPGPAPGSGRGAGGGVGDRMVVGHRTSFSGERCRVPLCGRRPADRPTRTCSIRRVGRRSHRVESGVAAL